MNIFISIAFIIIIMQQSATPLDRPHPLLLMDQINSTQYSPRLKINPASYNNCSVWYCQHVSQVTLDRKIAAWLNTHRHRMEGPYSQGGEEP